MQERRYKFSWELLGDIGARENLGPLVRVEVYRLMQFCFRDVLEKRYGTEETDSFFREAGKLAGEQFCRQFFSEEKDFASFVNSAQKILRDLGVGILRVEEADLNAGSFVMTVGEDLDCSGLPELDYEFCAYDEGFLAGLLGAFTKREVTVKEVDCWCTGARTCRFQAQLL